MFFLAKACDIALFLAEPEPEGGGRVTMFSFTSC